MYTLYILVGISGSGKTTWAKKFKERTGIDSISSDSVRERFLKDINDQSRNKEIFEFVKQWIDFQSSFGDFVYDATNCNLKYLKETIDKFSKLYMLKFVYFDIDLKDAIQNVKNRTYGANTPTKVIKRQYRHYSETKDWLLTHHNKDTINSKKIWI